MKKGLFAILLLLPKPSWALDFNWSDSVCEGSMQVPVFVIFVLIAVYVIGKLSSHRATVKVLSMAAKVIALVTLLGSAVFLLNGFLFVIFCYKTSALILLSLILSIFVFESLKYRVVRIEEDLN